MSGPAWQALSGLPAWEIIQIPRPPEFAEGTRSAGNRPGRQAAQRSQVLAAAFHLGAPVAFGWVRDQESGPVRVIAAGPGLVGSSDRGEAVLTLPAGARGSVLTPGGAGPVLSAISCWTPVAVVTDALLADSDEFRDTDGVRPSLEEGLLTAWTRPFGWLVLAEPVDGGRLGELVSQVALDQLGAQRLDSPRAQLAARRAAARHAELRQAEATGLWDIRLLAGSDSHEAAAQVAGLLCASADLGGLPYALVPGRGCGALAEILGDVAWRGSVAEPGGDGHGLLQDIIAMHPAARAAPRAQPGNVLADVRAPGGNMAAPGSADPVPEFPCTGSSRLLAVLARPPAREVPGVRFTLRPDFDVTPETGPAPRDAVDDGGLLLGQVLDWNRIPAGALTAPRSSLNRHVFVCGATGSGKSQTIRHLLQSAAYAGVPWLVIEPAKAEYKLMAARLPGTQVITIRPGDLDVPPAGVNPLEPAAGPDGARFPLQAHADLVRALFLAAFEAEEPFPQVLAAALTRCYDQAGWDLVTGLPLMSGVHAAYPGLADLQAAAMNVVEEIGYGREITDNVRGFVTVRISSLRFGTTGRFLDGGHPLDFGKLLESNVVLEIEDCGDDRDKAFLTGAVLIRLAEYLRTRQRAEGPAPTRLRHLTVVEEAHRLLRQPPPGTGSGPAAHAVEMFAGLLAEIRAYGEGLIIAEQIPSKLIPDVIKNSAVKIVHRLPALDDRDSVGATMNLTPDQSRYLVTLVPGEAAVHADGMDYPLLVRIPDGTEREIRTPAQTASPAGIITARSLSCGTDCRRQPCTLAQMRAAQHVAGRDPRITLWAELAVVAHLTGWIMPMPGPGFTTDLAAPDRRLRDCALSHAVDQAVASRIAAIAGHVSGSALAVHVTAAMRGALDSQQWLCAREEPQWLAPAYRWALVLDALRGHERDHPGASRHARTAEWEAAYGRAVPGSTCAEQIATVQRWDEAARRDQEQVRIIRLGTQAHSAIEQAVGARIGDSDWGYCITEALADFPGCDWPLDQLRPPPGEALS